MEPRWPIGTLVVERGAEDAPHAVRTVIGYKPDGRCMTTYVNPPPWLTPAERRRIFVGDAHRLTPAPAERAPAACARRRPPWRHHATQAARQLAGWWEGASTRPARAVATPAGSEA